MQARDAWQKVDNATNVARAIDGQANQAISGAASAKNDLNSFGAAALSASKATPLAPPPSSTYSASAIAVASAPIVAPATLNSIGQPIGLRFSIKA